MSPRIAVSNPMEGSRMEIIILGAWAVWTFLAFVMLETTVAIRGRGVLPANPGRVTLHFLLAALSPLAVAVVALVAILFAIGVINPRTTRGMC